MIDVSFQWRVSILSILSFLLSIRFRIFFPIGLLPLFRNAAFHFVF